MTENTKHCVKCGKEKRPSLSGSFTQWILDSRYCACDKIAKGLGDDPKTDYCSDCGKPLVSRRDGSMTQWIFRSSSCACQRPERRRHSTAAIRASVESDPKDRVSKSDEVELILDSKKFPVDRYKPILELGRGASGSVYLCRDRLLGIKVAVKTLHVLDKEQLISFQNEARANSRLNHISILKLLDFGPTDSGAPYMVLEYFDGTSLDVWIKSNGLLDAGDAVEIFAQIVSALSLAHKHNVFHRDLKPQNILVLRTSPTQIDVKLIDFGIAAVRQDSQILTAVHGRTLAGTPAYMPPDIVRGGKFDCRSEIYSLGCVLYECLSGRPPFVGETALELLRQHVEAPVPPLNMTRAQSVTQALERLVLKCLEKNPDDRYSSMDELEAELAKIWQDSLRDTIDKVSIYGHTIDRLQNRAPTQHVKRNWSIATAGCMSILLIGYFLLTPSDKSKASRPLTRESEARQTAKKSSSRLSAQKASLRSTERDEQSKEMAVTFGVAASQQLLEEEATKGDVTAQRKLGVLYYKGDGVPRDPKKAFSWALKAAKAGDAESQNMVGYMYEAGEGVAKSEKEALYWFKMAADNGNVQALISSGRMHRSGIGTKVDYIMAAKFFRKAIVLGSQTAKTHLGSLYQTGRGVEQNYTKALQLYQSAAATGDSSAMCNLGTMYQDGSSVPRDLAVAAKYYGAAAKAGNLDAHRMLGNLYEVGLVFPRSIEKAYEHYKFASDRASGPATKSLGVLFTKGLLGKERVPEAIPLFRKAVEQGDKSANVELGLAYLRGWGCKKDVKGGVRLIRESAERGDPWGQYYMAGIYQFGDSVPIDFKIARYWYELSAKQKNQFAQANLGIMYLAGMGGQKDYTKALHWLNTASIPAVNVPPDTYAALGYMYAEGLGVKANSQISFNNYLNAAKLGESRSQAIVALMLEQGEGVKKDLEAAKYWRGKLAAGGYKDVPKDLDEARNFQFEFTRKR